MDRGRAAGAGPAPIGPFRRCQGVKRLIIKTRLSFGYVLLRAATWQDLQRRLHETEAAKSRSASAAPPATLRLPPRPRPIPRSIVSSPNDARPACGLRQGAAFARIK